MWLWVTRIQAFELEHPLKRYVGGGCVQCFVKNDYCYFPSILSKFCAFLRYRKKCQYLFCFRYNNACKKDNKERSLAYSTHQHHHDTNHGIFPSLLNNLDFEPKSILLCVRRRWDFLKKEKSTQYKKGNNYLLKKPREKSRKRPKIKEERT